MSTGSDDVFTTWVSEIDDRGAYLVCLCGELDTSSVPRFLSEMQQIIARRTHVIIDVHLLEYLDSSGAAAIVSTKQALDRVGRTFCLAGSHGLVSKVLRATRLDAQIASFEDVTAALGHLGNG